jgi:hypothetical protein
MCVAMNSKHNAGPLLALPVSKGKKFEASVGSSAFLFLKEFKDSLEKKNIRLIISGSKQVEKITRRLINFLEGHELDLLVERNRHSAGTAHSSMRRQMLLYEQGVLGVCLDILYWFDEVCPLANYAESNAHSADDFKKAALRVSSFVSDLLLIFARV